uniref:Interleukin 17 n=1 Tax=Pinctada fucata x Pinctada maculata TaxID=329960 RepID=L7SWT1_9BIVA|nr:interleukin 17 [Pinctada fucata x Pinctada maculata]
MYKIILLVLLGAFGSFVQSSPLPPCQEPENLDDLFKNLTYQGNMDFILPPFMNEETNVIPPPEEVQYLTGLRTCPGGTKDLEVGMDTPLSSRSTCPFYFVTTHDSRRYPASITEARCSCTSCLDFDGPSPRNKCEPMYRSIKVIVKHECVNNIWKYKVATYLKQESCTCALPREVKNGQQESSSGSETGDPEPM